MATYRHNTRVDVPTLFRLWHDYNVSNHELMRRLNITLATFYTLRDRHKLPKRPASCYRANSSQEAHSKCPSPEEIAERAAAIRQGWSDEERVKRMGGSNEPERWTPPQFHWNHRGVLTAG
jgi:hypothetical protein